MARYIKVNPKVAAYLNLQNDRLAVKDGNYILWQADMLAFGPLTRLSEILSDIGAVALMPHEARQEQDGTILRPLPVAADPRFKIISRADHETSDGAGTSENLEEQAAQPLSDSSGETPESEAGTIAGDTDSAAIVPDNDNHLKTDL